jgi:RNA recognition motif-containing protein
MSNKIYVGNLNFTATENELADVFAEFGNVNDATIIFDKFTNRSKGFGFVEMETAEDAAAAIEALNGKEFKGREMRVNEAVSKPQNRRDNYRY